MCKKCARNATGRGVGAKRLAAWRLHAATKASCCANIITRDECGGRESTSRRSRRDLQKKRHEQDLLLRAKGKATNKIGSRTR